MRMRVLGALAMTVAAGAALGLAPAEAATTKKEPPACAAISFRPVATGTPDGEQEAGSYKSRFGRIEIKADVKGGAASNYYMVINGKRADAMPTPPAASEKCLTSKSVKLPFEKQAQGACTGDRFRVVIDRSGAKPMALFFGLRGNAWAYCNAAAV